MRKGIVLMCAVITALILGSCVPTLEPVPNTSENISYDTYVKVETGSLAARSLSASQVTGVINYYELIVNKLDSSDHPTATFISDRRYKDQGGSLVVPVEIGEVYNVLLLMGYRYQNTGETVLLKSAFGTSDPIVRGANTVTLTVVPISIDPATDYVFNNDKIPITGTTSPVRENDGVVMQVTLPKTTPDTNGDLQITIDGVTPLISAFLGVEGGDYSTIADSLFVKETLSLTNELAYGSFPITPWTVDTGLTYSCSSVDATVLEFPLATGIWPTVDADAKLNFQATYYGFVRPDDAGGNSEPEWSESDAIAAGFTKWTVRNGVDNSYDFVDKTGGAIFVIFGDGSGGPGPTAITFTP
jgi:hypothetical protein